jgi:hypothetical protein
LALGPLGRPGAGRHAAQHRLGRGQDLLRVQSDHLPQGRQGLPAALVIDQVGHVLRQHELPAVGRGHRVGRAARLLELIEQRRQLLIRRA